MTGKQLSFTMAKPLVVPRIERSTRPALLSLVARLLASPDPIRSRLQAARTSLEQAVARLECRFQNE